MSVRVPVCDLLSGLQGREASSETGETAEWGVGVL